VERSIEFELVAGKWQKRAAIIVPTGYRRILEDGEEIERQFGEEEDDGEGPQDRLSP
jgi:hypothetical protein